MKPSVLSLTLYWTPDDSYFQSQMQQRMMMTSKERKSTTATSALPLLREPPLAKSELITHAASVLTSSFTSSLAAASTVFPSSFSSSCSRSFSIAPGDDIISTLLKNLEQQTPQQQQPSAWEAFASHLCRSRSQRILSLQVNASVTNSTSTRNNHETLTFSNLSFLRFEITHATMLHSGYLSLMSVPHVFRALNSKNPNDQFDDSGSTPSEFCFPPSVNVLQMPHVLSHGVWENLHFNVPPPPPQSNRSDHEAAAAGKGESEIARRKHNQNCQLQEQHQQQSDPKAIMLCYAQTSLKCAEAAVDMTKIAWGRGILLASAPGLGKSTLCRGLAHQLALQQELRKVYIVDINANQLISRWLGDSAKAVDKAFAIVRALATHATPTAAPASNPSVSNDNRNNVQSHALASLPPLVVVVIDEIETITIARRKSLNGNEPGDTMRVVNAVLTQLDQIRSIPNVFLLFTSNLVAALDPAFYDRVDLVIEVPPPSNAVALRILASGVLELVQRGLVEPHPLLAGALHTTIGQVEQILIQASSYSHHSNNSHADVNHNNASSTPTHAKNINDTSASSDTPPSTRCFRPQIRHREEDEDRCALTSSHAVHFSAAWKSGRSLRRVAFLALVAAHRVGGGEIAAASPAAVQWPVFETEVFKLLSRDPPDESRMSL